MPSSRIALPCQSNTLESAATLSNLCQALQCFTGYTEYTGYFSKDFLVRAEVGNRAAATTSILTLYTPSTLEVRKKTKGYRPVA